MLHFGKIIRCLMMMLLLAGIILCLTSTRGTAAEISTNDQREIMTDTLTLLSENEELKQQITSERQAHDELIKELRSYQEVAKQQIALLSTQNALLSEEVTILKQKVKQANQRTKIFSIIGFGLGFGLKCLL